MSCDEARNLISVFLDGMLTKEEAQGFMQHIKACADCRKEFEELDKILRVIRKLPPEAPKTDMWAEFAPRLEAIRSESQTVDIHKAQGYLSAVLKSISEGWRIFLFVVQHSTGRKLQRLARPAG